MALAGKERCKLDDRGRMPIPARFKDAFEFGVWVTRSSNFPCVVLHTQESFNEAANDIERLPEDEQGMEARRDFWEWVFEQKKDAQNRISIEPDLQAWAGFDKDLVAVGLGRYVEVWNAETWEARRENRVTARQDLTPTLAALKNAARGIGG